MNTELDLSMIPGYEILKPLTSGWIAKIEAAKRDKAHWQEVADECEMFYSKSAAAMWKPEYERKFWRGVKAPKFRITLNLAFELVAVFAPNLLWDVPYRNVESKRQLQLPQQFLQMAEQNPALQQMLQYMMPMQQQSEGADALVATLLGTWLNYTPHEQPKGGLIGQSEFAVIDALVKGRGVLWSKNFKMPQSDQNLTGSFRESPNNLLIDPDFKSLEDAKWIAMRRVHPHWELERRFRLPVGSLKNRASLESSWSSDGTNEHRQSGQTNDLVVWYEIFSKTGCGARMTGMHMPVKDYLEQVVGDFAYLAIAPSVPFPLNCSSRDLQVGGAMGAGLSDEDVRAKFAWPIPFWGDDRWPIEVLDFYSDTESAWPIPPLSPGLGELKFLNFLIPWAANRIYSSSRDFWAVAGPHVEHYKKYLEEGLDQTILPTPLMVDDIRSAIMVMQQPETRFDIWKIIDLVSNLFAKRVGLTETAYGRNENGTQNRSAEETQSKARAVGIRPDHMRNKVAKWQSKVAALEAFCARWFVEGKDVEPLMGPMGRLLWEQYVMSTNVQLVTREMKYTIAASSIRRPDRNRDIDNLTAAMQYFAPAIQQYCFATGNYEPYNGLMAHWGELHDMRMDKLFLPPPPPPPTPQPSPQDQVELATAQMALQGQQIDLESAALRAQAAQAQSQANQAKANTELQAARLKMQMTAAGDQQALQSKAEQGQLDLALNAAVGQQELQQTAMTNAMDLGQKVAMNQIKVQQAKQKFKTGSKT